MSGSANISVDKVPFIKYTLAGPEKGFQADGLGTKDAFGNFAKGFQLGVSFYFKRARK